jgi:hypothetical protein
MRAIAEMIGAGGSAVSRAFDLMEIAEAEIERAVRDCALLPRVQRHVWNSFGLLAPGELARYSDAVYRSHARELLNRVMTCRDTRLGTRAEVLAAISALSLQSRLDRDLEQLALNLADALFPGRGLRDDSDRETYSGAQQERFEEFARKLAKHERVLPSELRELPARLREPGFPSEAP